MFSFQPPEPRLHEKMSTSAITFQGIDLPQLGYLATGKICETSPTSDFLYRTHNANESNQNTSLFTTLPTIMDEFTGKCDYDYGAMLLSPLLHQEDGRI